MKCPSCSEDIQPDAKKCRYCGEWLVEADKRPGTKPTEQGSVDARAVARGIKKQKQDEDAAGCLGSLGLVAAIAVGFWVGGTVGFWVGVVIFVLGMIFAASQYNKE